MDRQKILVVEDVAEIRESLKDLLEISGYSVITASNGREAMDHLNQNPSPSLILLDLMMPVMNGWEFLEQREKSEKLLNIPVVVTTAAGESKLQDVKNANAVIKKPIEFATLLSWVERFCGIPEQTL